MVCILVVGLFAVGFFAGLTSAVEVEPVVRIISTPSAPQNLVGASGCAKVELTWSPPANDGGSPITNYKLYRDTAPSPSVLLTILGNVLAYTDTLVFSGKTYYYVVSAENIVGEGPKSNEISVTRGQYTLHAPIRINNDTDFDIQFPARVISNLIIDTNTSDGIFIGNTTAGFKIYNNYLNSTGFPFEPPFVSCSGITLYNVTNGRLENNSCSSEFQPIELYSCNNVTIKNNQPYNGAEGITIQDTINCTIENNTIFNMRCDGIGVSSSTNISIMNNSISCQAGLSMMSIWISSSINCTIVGNYAADANWNGIYLDSSNNNVISSNICSTNAQYGIELNNASNNIVVGNNLTDNSKYGINVSSGSAYNHIHHNIFINNNGATATYDSSHIQAYDELGNNFWNYTYPSGGNYWSDWTIPDVKKGPNQDQPGNDGIVDSPYILDGNPNAEDIYPLVSPLVNDSLGTGNITVFVADSLTGYGIVSANVTIPILGLTKTTDNSGYSNITDILPGKYDITASKSGYENSTRSVTVIKNETVSVMVYLKPILYNETNVMGKVVDNSTSNPISNATIRLGNYTTKSDSDGKYLLKLQAGNYTLNVTKDGYKPYQREIQIVTGNNTINITLDPVESKSALGSNIYMMATIVLIAVVSVSSVWFAASFIRKKKKPAEIYPSQEIEETKEENHESLKPEM